MAETQDLLRNVPKPQWFKDCPERELVDWFFVWYGCDSQDSSFFGPHHTKQPPEEFGFILEIVVAKKPLQIICQVGDSDKGWKNLNEHERQYFAFGAVPRAKAIVEALNKNGGIF